MKAIWLCLLATIMSATGFAQTNSEASEPPQTARQALIEMFTGKRVDSLQRHLPEATLRALGGKGGNSQNSLIFQISMMAHQAQAQQNRLQTFDVGPILMSTEQNNGREKFELIVERDDLQGEEDQIELSLKDYENGELQVLPVIPRIIFLMQQEKEIWRLSKITLQGEFPLSDPDYLKGLQDRQNKSLENMTRFSLNAIVRAENSYAAKNSDRGYSCKLNDLFSTNFKAGSEQLFNPDLAKGESNDYRFSITGCDAPPSTKFQVIAVPVDPDSGLKTFCTDQSGSVRYIKNGKPAECLTSGHDAK